MDIFKKALLYFVGTIAVAYEEVTKAVRRQQKKAEKAQAKAKA